MITHDRLSIHTSGQGLYSLTHHIDRIVHQRGIQVGLCHVFIQHTSASLIINENTDHAVQSDLEQYMKKIGSMKN